MKFAKIFITVIFLMCVTLSSVYGFSPSKKEHYSLPVGEEYLFVMLGLDENQDEPLISSASEVYLKSGLYVNDGTINPLWTISEYMAKKAIYISEDGQYLVKTMGELVGYNQWNSKIIAFYENGKLLKEYSIDDVILYLEKPLGLTWISNQFLEQYEWSFTTDEDNQFFFDIRTGDLTNSIINNESPNVEKNWAKFIILFLGSVIISSLIFVTVKKLKGYIR